MTNTTNTAADSVTAILFEHEDGRYAINPNTTGDPAWHRLGPVDVSAIAAEPAQPVAQEGGTLVKLIEKKIAGMSPSEASAFMAARAALAASGNDQAAPDMRDPYGGAREDLAIWRKRALEAEALNRKFATSVNGPTFMGEPADSDSALMAREIHESQEDTLLICASDLQHSAIYDNHIEMQSCIRAVADRITALASVIDGVERAALAAPAQPVAWALQWPDDSRLNISTVFDTQLEATDYLKSCSDGVVVVPLYAAPQPAAQDAPVDATVQEDAERWQFLAEYLVGTRTDLDDEIVGCDSVQKMARVLDATIAAQKETND